MSFLLAEDDPQETLQVALAFIDAWEGGDVPLTTTTSSRSSAASTTCSSPTSTRSNSSGSFDSPASQSSSSSADQGQRTKSTGDDGGDSKRIPFADAVAAFVLTSGTQQQQYQRPQSGMRPGTIKNNGDAVRRSRAKKKAETDFLREQVAQLEATLSELQCTRRAENGPLQVYLQQMRTGSDSSGDGEYEANQPRFTAIQPKAPVSLWLEMAIFQAQESKKAQLLNAELKDAVSRQFKLAKSLETLLLNKKASQFGLHLLRDEQRQFLHNSNAALTQEASVIAELWQRVQQIYLELDSTLNHQSWVDIADSVVCSSQLRLDPVAGAVAELHMNAPLRCGFHQAAEILWRRVFETSDVIQTPHYYMRRQRLTDTSCQKNYTMVLDGPDGAIELHGISYVEILSGVDRDAYTWASTILCTQSGEVFREKGWIVASSRANASSSSNNYAIDESLLRGYHQVSSDSRTDAATSPQTKHQREFILKTLGNRIRAFQQFMQDMLLHEFAGFRMKTPLLLSDAASCQCCLFRSSMTLWRFMSTITQPSCNLIDFKLTSVEIGLVALCIINPKRRRRNPQKRHSSMSFLVDEDDAQATLQVALAFIDACDDSMNDTSSSSSSPVTLSSSSSSPNSHTTTSDSEGVARHSDTAVCGAYSGIYIPSDQQQQQGARAKRVTSSGRSKGNVEAVRRLREKKKAEAVYLREQVGQLEAKLRELQQAQKTGNSLQVYLQRMWRGDVKKGEPRLLTGSGGDNQEETGGGEDDEDDEQLVAMVQPKDGAPLWVEIAAVQVQERLKSQALNAELKDAVAKQIKLVESIEAMLANKANQFGLDLLRDEQKQFLHSRSVLAQETGILIELQHHVEQMYLRVDSLFAPQFWTEIADSVMCSIRLKYDPVSSPFVELRMNAPLPCSFQDAGEAIWKRTINLNDVIQTPTYSMKKQLLSKTSLQKVFTLVLDGPAGPVELRGTAYVQRFTDANRFVCLWVSALRSNQGETYREQGWSVASACSSSSSSFNTDTQTLFRVYFQVACDSHEDAALGPEARERREFVLKTLGNRTRAYYLYTQNLLLDQFAGFQSRQPLLLTGTETC